MSYTGRLSKNVGGVTCYRCTKCSKWKPFEDFRVLSSKVSRCGRLSWCRHCESAAGVEAKRARREQQSASQEAGDAIIREQRFRQRMIARGFMQPMPILRETSLPPLKTNLYGRSRATRVGKRGST